MNRHTGVRALIAVLGLIVLLVAIRGWRMSRRQFDATGEPLTRVDSGAVSAEVVDKGRLIFHGPGTCALCHGQKLEGIVGPTLRAHAWKDAKDGSLGAIFGVITHGVPSTAMVAHPGGITDAQATQVATYIWAVSHGKAQP